MNALTKFAFVGLLFAIAGCNGFGFKNQAHTFKIDNSSSLDVKSIAIELDDGNSRDGKGVHVFDAIRQGRLSASDSTTMRYKFVSSEHGDGLYRMIVIFDNGNALSKEFGYFDSSLNVNATFNLSISEDEIVYINKTVP